MACREILEAWRADWQASSSVRRFALVTRRTGQGVARIAQVLVQCARLSYERPTARISVDPTVLCVARLGAGHDQST